MKLKIRFEMCRCLVIFFLIRTLMLRSNKFFIIIRHQSGKLLMQFEKKELTLLGCAKCTILHIYSAACGLHSITDFMLEVHLCPRARIYYYRVNMYYRSRFFIWEANPGKNGWLTFEWPFLTFGCFCKSTVLNTWQTCCGWSTAVSNVDSTQDVLSRDIKLRLLHIKPFITPLCTIEFTGSVTIPHSAGR